MVLITKGLYDPKNGIVKITTDREHILPVSYRGNIESNEEEIEVVVIMTEAKELAVQLPLNGFFLTNSTNQSAAQTDGFTKGFSDQNAYQPKSFDSIIDPSLMDGEKILAGKPGGNPAYYTIFIPASNKSSNPKECGMEEFLYEVFSIEGNGNHEKLLEEIFKKYFVSHKRFPFEANFSTQRQWFVYGQYVPDTEEYFSIPSGNKTDLKEAWALMRTPERFASYIALNTKKNMHKIDASEAQIHLTTAIITSIEAGVNIAGGQKTGIDIYGINSTYNAKQVTKLVLGKESEKPADKAKAFQHFEPWQQVQIQASKYYRSAFDDLYNASPKMQFFLYSVYYWNPQVAVAGVKKTLEIFDKQFRDFDSGIKALQQMANNYNVFNVLYTQCKLARPELQKHVKMRYEKAQVI